MFPGRRKGDARPMAEIHDDDTRRTRKGLRGEVDLAIKREFERYVEDDNDMRMRRGEWLSPGEQKGTAYAVEDLVCWFLSLGDADRARIRKEGRALRDQVAAMPAEERDLPFGQRKDSVLCEEPGPRAGQGAGGRSRPLPTKRGRQPEGQDAAPPLAGRADCAPVPI